MMAWLNGALVDTAMIAAHDRGFTLGDGLFETLLFESAAPRLFERHWARLADGAARLAIPLSRPAAEIQKAVRQLAEASGVETGAVRLTLTRGPAPRGVLPPTAPTPTWLITLGPLPVLKPVDLVIATVTRRNEHSPLSRIKSLSYLDNILALQEAVARGADDALLLNTAGRIAEATTTNCFFRIGDRLATPPLADGALPGIARGLLIEHCGALEMSLTPDDLVRASAGFLSNALGLRPVRTIEGRPCGSLTDPLVERCRQMLQSILV